MRLKIINVKLLYLYLMFIIMIIYYVTVIYTEWVTNIKSVDNSKIKENVSNRNCPKGSVTPKSIFKEAGHPSILDIDTYFVIFSKMPCLFLYFWIPYEN